jgi:hypothetical protein
MRSVIEGRCAECEWTPLSLTMMGRLSPSGSSEIRLQVTCYAAVAIGKSGMPEAVISENESGDVLTPSPLS